MRAQVYFLKLMAAVIIVFSTTQAWAVTTDEKPKRKNLWSILTGGSANNSRDDYANPPSQITQSQAAVVPESPYAQANQQIVDAYNQGKSNFLVESEGVITKVLKDDQDGNKHQRMIVRLDNGHTLLLAHNIDLAIRVGDPKPGERIKFRGEYEWNSKGGVVHWTHRDPNGLHQGGWLEYREKKYY